jgi:hypothetical protein
LEVLKVLEDVNVLGDGLILVVVELLQLARIIHGLLMLVLVIIQCVLMDALLIMMVVLMVVWKVVVVNVMTTMVLQHIGILIVPVQQMMELI